MQRNIKTIGLRYKKLEEETRRWSTSIPLFDSMVTVAVGLFMLWIFNPGSVCGYFVAIFAISSDSRYFYLVLQDAFNSHTTRDGLWKLWSVAVVQLLNLIILFAIIYKALNQVSGAESELDYLYFSTVTFTTLGYGDLVPEGISRLVAMFEALIGFVATPLIAAKALDVILNQRSQKSPKSKDTP